MTNKRKSRAALVSVISNSTLVIVKLVVGVLSGSVSILSEAIHSANDLLASLIALFSVRISDRPADVDHPFGHGKAESISGLVEAALILVAAAWIIYEAVKRIQRGGEVAHLELGTAVMVLSVIMNSFVAKYLFRVAREEDSLALEADAQHLSTDVYTSLGVALGLALVWITGWHIFDPIIAIIVAVLIAGVGWKLVKNAGHHLMDSSLPPNEITEISDILNAENRVVSWHELRTRKAGSQRHIDLHIVLPSESTLLQAHDIADDLEKKIAKRLNAAHVVIHVDPYDDR